VHGPADKPYGQRELLVLAPDGELIVFGMAVSDSQTEPWDSHESTRRTSPLANQATNNFTRALRPQP
jgi:hypothetical protein